MAHKRRKKSLKMYRLLPVLIVIIALFFVIIVEGLELNEKNKAYAIKKAELEQEILAEEERAIEIEEHRIYVTTDEYKKEVLREKFNYADKNEIVFRFNN